MRPARDVSGEDGFRVEGKGGTGVIRRDPVRAEPEGTLVLPPAPPEDWMADPGKSGSGVPLRDPDEWTQAPPGFRSVEDWLEGRL